jgi:hypothetical protein
MTVKARYKFYFQLEDELFDDEGTKNQLYYAYSGATAVQSVRTEPQFKKYNKKALMLLRGMILNHQFWFSEAEEADDLWNNALIPLLKPTVKRTFELQEMYQNKPDKVGIPLDYFERFFLKLDPYVFNFEGTRNLEVSTVVDAVEKTRVWLNDGTFDGGSLVQIDIPYIAPEIVPEIPLENESEPTAEEVAPSESAQEEVSPVLDELADADTTTVQETGEESADSAAEEVSSDALVEEEVKPVDYTIWEIFFSDGSSKYFDSEQGTWTELQVDEETAENQAQIP